MPPPSGASGTPGAGESDRCGGFSPESRPARRARWLGRGLGRLEFQASEAGRLSVACGAAGSEGLTAHEVRRVSDLS